MKISRKIYDENSNKGYFLELDIAGPIVEITQ